MVGYYKCDLGTRHCVHLDDMHRIDEINSLVTCPKNDVHHKRRLMCICCQ